MMIDERLRGGSATRSSLLPVMACEKWFLPLNLLDVNFNHRLSMTCKQRTELLFEVPSSDSHMHIVPRHCAHRVEMHM
jgi:hypothetical protein